MDRPSIHGNHHGRHPRRTVLGARAKHPRRVFRLGILGNVPLTDHDGVRRQTLEGLDTCELFLG
jgi:hypothetical protein